MPKEGRKEWVVVEFLAENDDDLSDCRAVPTTWLFGNEEDLMCYYPHNTLSSWHTNFSIQAHGAPQQTWNKYRVRKFPLSVCDSYDKAKELEHLAVETSDLDAGKPLGRGQRRKRQRRLPLDSSDDDADSNHGMKRIPSPPKLSKELHMEKHREPVPNESGPSNVCPSRNEKDNFSSQAQTSDKIKPSYNEDRPLIVVDRSPDVPVQGCVCGSACCQESRQLILQLENKVQSSNVLLREVVEGIQGIMAAVNSLGAHDTAPLPVIEELCLPVGSQEDFIAMEEKLKVRSYRELVKKELRVQGGVSLVASVNAIMYHSLTDSLAKSFTYHGVPARNKTSFKDTEINKVIFEAIQGRTSLASTSKKEVGKAVAEWLRQAGARCKRKNVLEIAE